MQLVEKSTKYINKLLHSLDVYTDAEVQKIVQAARYAAKAHQGQHRDSGEPYIIHPIFVSEILAGMRLDCETIIAGLLHDLVEDTSITAEDIRNNFGPAVARLVEGLTNVPFPKQYSKNKQSIANIQKMLIASIQDIRIILIKLADKLHNIYTIASKPPERQRNAAREILDIYAPLAEQLGIESIKNKLEDNAFKILQPKIYNRLKQQFQESEKEADTFLKKMGKTITDLAANNNIYITYETRRKNIYSLAQKMQHHSLLNIYDILGIRIICKELNECYVLLGLVHATWVPLEDRFKDYIALQKANRYQSLHTTVMGPDGKRIEFQIRTEFMHQTAEHGIAAHWNYKHRIQSVDEQLSVMQKLQQLKQVQQHELLDEVKREILQDSIYVFTPQGDIISLPVGATARDFAYHIHTDIGHHAAIARANGIAISLNTPLQNTQTIQIHTSANVQPKLEWLQHCRTTRARSKIREWLNYHEQHVLLDKQLVVKTHMQETTKPGNTKIRLAACCSPSIGETITAFWSKSRGIIVHRSTCRNLKYISNLKSRIVPVEWEPAQEAVTASLQVSFPPHASEMLKDIERVAKEEDVSLNALTIERQELLVQILIHVTSRSKTNIYRFSRTLRKIPGIKVEPHLQSYL